MKHSESVYRQGYGKLDECDAGVSTARPPHRDHSGELNIAQDRANFGVIDGSDAIFTLYLEMALKEDKEMVDGWNQDAKSVLLFVSYLFLCQRTPHLRVAERIVLCHGCGSF